jgi:hypothetical protein
MRPLKNWRFWRYSVFTSLVAIAIGAQAQGTIAQSVPTPAASPPVVKPAAPFAAILILKNGVFETLT